MVVSAKLRRCNSSIMSWRRRVTESSSSVTKASRKPSTPAHGTRMRPPPPRLRSNGYLAGDKNRDHLLGTSQKTEVSQQYAHVRVRAIVIRTRPDFRTVRAGRVQHERPAVFYLAGSYLRSFILRGSRGTKCYGSRFLQSGRSSLSIWLGTSSNSSSALTRIGELRKTRGATADS